MNTISFQPMMESRPIREIAYEVLKHAIITGEIPAGERIVETDTLTVCTSAAPPCARPCASWSATAWWSTSCAAAWWCAPSPSLT